MDYNPVTKPSHYQLRYPCNEVRDVINERVASAIDSNAIPYSSLYDYSNAVKYLLRAPFKSKIKEDLEKAKYCIENMLDMIDSV